MKSSPHSPQLEEARMQQGRPITAINKVNELFFKKERKEPAPLTHLRAGMNAGSQQGRKISGQATWASLLCLSLCPSPPPPWSPAPLPLPLKKTESFPKHQEHWRSKRKMESLLL